MYTPPYNRQDDPAEIRAFLRAFPFATLVTVGPDGLPRATHLPFLLEGGESLRLFGHLAVANRQGDDLTGEQSALVIFQGPHAYISPVHYEKPQNVPTWNYVAVHAHGSVRPLTTNDDKRRVVDAMVRHFDPAYTSQHESLPADFIHAKLKGFTAFEIVVERIEARWKLSQDRTPTERETIANALSHSADSAVEATARHMESTVT